MTDSLPSNQLARYECQRGGMRPNEYGAWVSWRMVEHQIDRLQSLVTRLTESRAKWKALAKEGAALMPSLPPREHQAEIVTINVRDGVIVDAIMKAPGLPDGDHDLFCEDTSKCSGLPADDAKDAERYRWLRDESHKDPFAPGPAYRSLYDGIGGRAASDDLRRVWLRYGDSLDRAIDEARLSL